MANKDLKTTQNNTNAYRCAHDSNAFMEGQNTCSGCRHKDDERSEEFKRNLTLRLNKAIGQLNGIKAMIEDNRYCGDILIQLSAVEKAIHRISEIVLEDHLETCVVDHVKQGDIEIVEEFMQLLRKFS